MILEVNNIYTSYGLSQALFGVSLKVNEGEVVSILGRNGVGKTTTLRSIMGLTPPRSGSIKWKGEEISSKPSYQIAKMGIGFVPEDRRIFFDLTVWENLDVAIKSSGKRGPSWTVERVFELFLMGNPELLLLDEPSEGLAPVVVQHLEEQISKLRDEGMTILLSEQNTQFSLDLSDRIYILEKGEVRYEGSVAEFLKDEESYKAYLTV